MRIHYIDTETHLLAPGCLIPRVVSLAAAVDDGAVDLDVGPEINEAWEAILKDCETNGSIIVGHNVAFDLAVLAEATGTLRRILTLYHRGLIRDTQIRQRLLDIARGDAYAKASLAACVARHLARNINPGKKAPSGVLEAVIAGDFSRLDELPPRYRFGQLDGIPLEDWPAEYIEYATDDVIYTRDVFKAQGGPELVDEANQCRAAFGLHLLSAWGIRTDFQAVRDVETRLRAQHVELESLLINLGVVEVKRRKDTARARAFVEATLGDKAPVTKSGKVSTSAKILEQAAAVLYVTNDTLNLSSLELEGFNADTARRGLDGDEAALGELKRHLLRRNLHLVGSWDEALDHAGVFVYDKKKNTKLVQALVGETLGDSAPLTDKGAISTSKDTLKMAAARAQAEGDEEKAEIFEALTDISRPAKMLQTYVPVLYSGIERPINARYNVLMASGRTSCSGPNMQNLPRKGGIRECFIPRPGNVFVQADWTSAEMVALAFINDLWGHGDAMKKAINEGRDLHLDFVAKLRCVPYDEIVAQYEAEGDEGPIHEARQFAKIANFGFPGGMGAESFVEYAGQWGIVVTLEQAQELKKGFVLAWPEMAAYFAKMAALVGDSSGSVTQVTSKRVRGGANYCQACNTPFQGLAADFAKYALWLITLACFMSDTGPLANWRPVIFIHDEFVLEGPEDEAEAALGELKRLMIKAAQKYLPGMAVRADGAILKRFTK